MKKLYEDQKYTIYEIQRKLGVNKDTLYKYARGEIEIENMPIKWVLDIAKIEGVEVNTLYQKMIKWQLKGVLSGNDK